MTLFMILAFPLLIAYSLISTKISSDNTYGRVALILGFLLAVLYSFFDLFFFPAYYLTPYVFLPNFFYAFINDIFIPVILCVLLLYIFVKKYDKRWDALYFILLGFYAVYFPARTFNINTTMGWYELFVKPLLMLSMVLTCKNIVTFLYNFVCAPKETFTPTMYIVLRCVIVLAFLFCFVMPPIFESLYMIDALSWFLAPIAIFYSSGIVFATFKANIRFF